MISLKKRNLNNKGFTIVELLIVIVVIGILALLVITTYSGIQAKARNAKRQTDIQAIQTQLEAFFSQNGYYPDLAQMNDPTWLGQHMGSLDKNALVDPSSTCDPTKNGCLVDGTGGADKQYQYHVTTSDPNTGCGGSDSSADASNCAKYTLTAKYEGTVNGASTYVKSNLD
ncbi:MAG TPA: prepilin-type N-terminal cleavage/methylation domain-containing protein [Candidatus Saccharimonadales bacterium]|jgi:prepilin-type N-terminal cleavage/methylation domain-containing protein|nr:prepilin-type N-terminal cleavage/methylation domain-containing protein [Candidatus Saccharimonadales bacterium]